LKMWRNYPMTLSFIWPASVLTLTKKITEYNQAGSVLSSLQEDLIYSGDKVHRLLIRPHSAFTTFNANTRRVRVELIGSAGGGGAGSGDLLSGSQGYFVMIGANPAGMYAFTGFAQKILNSGSWAGATDFITVEAYNGPVTPVGTVASISPGDYIDLTALGAVSIPGAWDRLFVTFSTGSFFTVLDADYAYNISYGALPTAMIQPLDIELEETWEQSSYDQMKKQVYLVWKDSTGGDAQQMFSVNQEHAHINKSGVRVKRLTLFADSLNYIRWEAINELNQPRETYRNNIIELNSSVVKTNSMIGQQVYIVASDGSKIGVVVVPTQARTDSKQERHSLTLTIELPEFYA
jgi:hypothetical protein